MNNQSDSGTTLSVSQLCHMNHQSDSGIKLSVRQPVTSTTKVTVELDYQPASVGHEQPDCQWHYAVSLPVWPQTPHPNPNTRALG